MEPRSNDRKGRALRAGPGKGLAKGFNRTGLGSCPTSKLGKFLELLTRELVLSDRAASEFRERDFRIPLGVVDWFVTRSPFSSSLLGSSTNKISFKDIERVICFGAGDAVP